MAKLGFIGLGAMGSRMAKRLIEAGNEVQVWNRSPEPAALMAAAGARVVESPRQAAEGAEAVLVMVRDDAASTSVWLDWASGIIAGLNPGSLCLECSTVSTAQINRLKSPIEKAGGHLVDVPVAGSRPQAEAGTLIFLAGGSPEDLEAAKDLTKPLSQAFLTCGPLGSGAAMKLIVNAVFGVQVALMAEALCLSDAQGLSRERTIDVLPKLPVVSPGAAAALAAMDNGNFAPAFPVDLVVKDFDLIERAGGQQLSIIETAGDAYRRALSNGLGLENITAIAKSIGAAARAP
ncbi:MAG: NAD(P)-dependent oxidoreductase [Magnetovibrionaceae bacterium]